MSPSSKARCRDDVPIVEGLLRRWGQRRYINTSFPAVTGKYVTKLWEMMNNVHVIDEVDRFKVNLDREHVGLGFRSVHLNCRYLLI
jgi:hypothetical protein